MTNDLVKRLREGTVQHVKRWSGDTHADLGGSCDEDQTDKLMSEAADRIEELQDIIARIQRTNLRRDMNLKDRTIEIDRLCKGEING